MTFLAFVLSINLSPTGGAEVSEQLCGVHSCWPGSAHCSRTHNYMKIIHMLLISAYSYSISHCCVVVFLAYFCIVCVFSVCLFIFV